MNNLKKRNRFLESEKIRLEQKIRMLEDDLSNCDLERIVFKDKFYKIYESLENGNIFACDKNNKLLIVSSRDYGIVRKSWGIEDAINFQEIIEPKKDETENDT